jgi:tetratricopeptide repeat protein
MAQAGAKHRAPCGIEIENASALIHQAITLTRLQRYDKALAAFETLLARQPDHISALNDCGGLHMRLGRPEAAIVCYDRALAVAPRLSELHINKGTALRALNRFEEALASFAAAAAIDPGRAEAHYDAGLVQLCLGDFPAGWRGYEWRWRKPDWANKRRNFSAPLWLGEEPIDGKTILLHAEQGFGDTIQFVRYVPLVARRGATVILECQPELGHLLHNIKGAARVFARGEVLPAFNLHCPLMSLPLALETELPTIPADIPYIWPQQERIAKWHERLPQNGRLRVGVCWAGNSDHANDRHRSMPLECFAKVLSVSGVDFVSLQKDVSAEQSSILSGHGVTQLGQDFADFADTAAVIALLDLVIAVDTSVAHLAGAMGKAVGILVPFRPDFRWMLHRTDSPWYPTMRLFRQSAIGDWDGPLERLRAELAAVGNRPVEPR